MKLDALAMKVALVGSRDYPETVAKAQIETYLASLREDTVIVSGGARGIDTIGRRLAEARGLVTITYEADWEGLGRAAGMFRNTRIVEHADKIVAFWDGVSRGTLDTIRKAVAAGKPVEIHYESGEVETR